MLGLYALLRQYFEVHVGDNLKAELASFQAACACVDVILRARRGVFAMSVAAVVPTLILFLFLRGKLIKGMAMVGIKS